MGNPHLRATAPAVPPRRRRAVPSRGFRAVPSRGFRAGGGGRSR
ncbi:hypothetical protein ACNTMW_07040 [Planosporangium sp. 12N6]